MPLREAMEWFTTDTNDYPKTQIGEEINFLRTRYEGIRPAMFLTYEREAYHTNDGSDLRITIDNNIQARMNDIDLTSDLNGYQILPEGYVLMEVKTMYGYPQWLTKVLGDNRLYKSSFSKYGNAYKEMVLRTEPEDFKRISSGQKTVFKDSQPIWSGGAAYRPALQI